MGNTNKATFFSASVELMKVMARACGHDRLDKLSRKDLATWDDRMAKLSGVDELEQDLSTLAVSVSWVAVSILGLLWTASGIYHGMQLAMNQVWNVEGVGRQGFVSRHARAAAVHPRDRGGHRHGLPRCRQPAPVAAHPGDRRGGGADPGADLGDAAAGHPAPHGGARRNLDLSRPGCADRRSVLATPPTPGCLDRHRSA